MEFIKPVSAFDSVFLILSQLRPPFLNQLVVQGSGIPSESDLISALETATEANPGSALRVVDSEDGLFWISDVPPRLRFIDAPNFVGNGVDDAPFLLEPFDPTQGPTCELMLVTGREHRFLIFRSMHAVMDGQGTILWAKDFMRALRGAPLIGHRSTLTSEQLWEALKSGHGRRASAPDAIPVFEMPRTTEYNGSFRWRRVTAKRPFDSGALTRIGVEIANLARRSSPSGLVRLKIPVDLRRHVADDLRTTGNLIGGLGLSVEDGTTAEMLSLRLVQMLYHREDAQLPRMLPKARALGPGFLAIAIASELAEEHTSGLYTGTATLSQLGRITHEQFSAPSFTASSCFFVPPFSDGSCYMAMNGFDQHLYESGGRRFTPDAIGMFQFQARQRGVDPQLLEQTTKDEQRSQHVRVLDAYRFGHVECGQEIGVLRDRLCQRFELTVLDPPQRKECALFDFAIAPVGFDEMVVGLPGAIARSTDEHASDSLLILHKNP